MASRCRHRRFGCQCKTPIWSGAGIYASVVGYYIRCQDCQAWLSLGEANDASEAVQVEIRAAEIERMRVERSGVLSDCLTDGESDGWALHWHHPYGRYLDRQLSAENEAGYLAREIYSHDEADHG